MYNKLPHFLQNLKYAIGVLYLFITEFTPNSCQSKAQDLCPDDWTYSQYSGTCVSVHFNSVDQSTARSQCQRLRADLVTILSLDMNIFIHDYLKTKRVVNGVWIGLRRKNGNFRWLDSKDKPSYFNWHSKEKEPSGQKCVQINGGISKDYKAWVDCECDLDAAYICEKLQSQRCPFGWIWSDSSWTCIKLFLNELTWNDARDTCKSHKGDLLVIHDEEMDNFLEKVLRGHKYDYWIGLKDRELNGVLRWLDNDKEAQYMNMALVLLNIGDCGQIRRPFDGWSLFPCILRNKFICERVTECPESRYGFKCSLNCSKNCGGPKNACDSLNGKCTHGCKDGYKGEMCDTECPGSTYGFQCSHNCSKHCEGLNNSCDSKNGTCTQGCKDGYKGQMCDTEINDITQATAGHRSPKEPGVHINDWTKLPAGGRRFFTKSPLGKDYSTESVFKKDNSIESAKRESNSTFLLQENVVSRKPDMLVAYLSAFAFAAVVIGVCMIPLCLSTDEMENEVLESYPRLSQGYEPEQLGECEEVELTREYGVGYDLEEDFWDEDFKEENFTTEDCYSIDDYFDYWSDEGTYEGTYV